MIKAVTLKCWTCAEPFEVGAGPGRPRRYCNANCKYLARVAVRRVRYVAKLEEQRIAHLADQRCK